MPRRFFSAAQYRHMARQTSPAIAAVLDGALADDDTTVEGSGSDLSPSATHTTNQVGAFGTVTVMDATAGNLTVQAPAAPGAGNKGKSWGYKVHATASAHTVTGIAHAAETFDGSTGYAPSAAGGYAKYTSDGTNWVLTGKI